MNKPEKVRELAQRIYVEMCGNQGAVIGTALADSAMDAAEVFVDTFNQRYGTDSSEKS
jgi:hypothetical protein